MSKIFTYILAGLFAFGALAIAGLFAYNGYKSNQLTERDIALKEKLVEKQVEQRELEKGKAEQENKARELQKQTEPYIQKVKNLKKSYENVPEKNKNTTSDDDWKYVTEQLN